MLVLPLYNTFAQNKISPSLKIILSVFILFFFTTNIFAQNSTKRFIKEGDISFAEGDFYSAKFYYKQAIDIDKTLIDVTFKYAEACRFISDYKSAEEAYNIVQKRKFNEYPLSLFWYAMMKKYNGDYKNAKKLFERYQKRFKKKDNYFSKKAAQEVLACEYARGLIKDSIPTKVVNIGKAVNTGFSDFAGYFVTDSLIYFSSLRGDTAEVETDKKRKKKNALSKIYFISKSRSQWRNAEVLDSVINSSQFNNANSSISADGKRLYFTKCSGEKNSTNCDIYVSFLSNGKWQKPSKLPDAVNMKGYNSTQPYISNDSINGEILYFASDRPGGSGKYDIWACPISGEQYQKAYNLGNKINSLDEEVSPFFDVENQLLFFSSDWHSGLGGFDIFKSSKDSSGWKEPENIGYPLNSSMNDLYYAQNRDGKKGMLSSNRKGSVTGDDETCCNDIYLFDVPPVKKVIITKEQKIEKIEKTMKLLVPLSLYFDNDQPDCCNMNTTTKKNYVAAYKDYLKMQDLYKREFSKGLKDEEVMEAQDMIDDFFVDKVETGFQELEEFSALLVKLLGEGEEVKITLKGYCSPLNTTEYNINLAQRRISSLRNYFNEYQNGVLVSYLNKTNTNGASLEIAEEPVGEIKASSTLSDKREDKRNSVYHPNAAIERKIEIIAIQVVK